MFRPAKASVNPALRAIARILSALGIGAGLAGCVVPGTSVAAFKPERIAPPPSAEISPATSADALEGSDQPIRDHVLEAPRRELIFPGTSALKPPPGIPE